MPSQKADKLGCWHMDRFLYSVKATTISKRMAMEQWKKLIVFEVRLNSKNNFMQIKGTSSIVNYWNISICFSYHGMDFISPPIWILLNTVLYQYFNIDFIKEQSLGPKISNVHSTGANGDLGCWLRWWPQCRR